MENCVNLTNDNKELAQWICAICTFAFNAAGNPCCECCDSKKKRRSAFQKPLTPLQLLEAKKNEKEEEEEEDYGDEYTMTRTGTEIQENSSDEEYPAVTLSSPVSCSPTNVITFKATNQPTML